MGQDWRGLRPSAMRIFWQDSMNFGLPEVDEEHRRMVGLLDGVCLALYGRDLPAAGRALNHFLEIMLDHFASEERLLTQFSDDEVEHHLEVHRNTTDLVEQLREAIVDDRDLAKAEHLLSELVHRWIRRLFTEDAELAARIKALSPAE
jgi:hemerythrin-like metal-binding protein